MSDGDDGFKVGIEKERAGLAAVGKLQVRTAAEESGYGQIWREATLSYGDGR